MESEREGVWKGGGGGRGKEGLRVRRRGEVERWIVGKGERRSEMEGEG